jgi:NAD(P)-dependent dehydrogenase (short-subunit alcohol dehydrogenase family)
MPAMSQWTASDVPDQSGRTAVITGANSGLGLETARVLASRGARVVMACRDPAKAASASARVAAAAGADASVEVAELDLADLSSVRRFAQAFGRTNERLDLLINNAGVMAIPERRTVDGFEMQLGTNHLGHFALTGLLLDRLLATPGSRVVNVASTAHRLGTMRFDDLHWRGGYRKWPAYGRSKLANLLFTRELARRLHDRAAATIAAAAHPGYAATNLQSVGARMEDSGWKERIFDIGNRLLAQSAEMGALPSLFAATAATVTNGAYYGPDGWLEQSGYPRQVTPSRRARRDEDARRLWEVSVEDTGVCFEALDG